MKILLSKKKFLAQGGQTLALAGGLMAGSWGLRTLEQRFPTWSVYTVNGLLIAGGLLLANLVSIPLLSAFCLGLSATGVVLLAGKAFSGLRPMSMNGFTPDEPGVYSDNVNAWQMGEIREAPAVGIQLPVLDSQPVPISPASPVYSQMAGDEEILSNQRIL